MEDTHHGLYLLVTQVRHQRAAIVDQVGRVAQQRVHGDLGGDPDVGERQAAARGLPLGDVHQPLAGRARLEQVAELKTWESVSWRCADTDQSFSEVVVNISPGPSGVRGYWLSGE